MEVLSPKPPQLVENSADVFVLSCIDPRFSYYMNFFLSYQKQLKHRYDPFSMAGASLGFLHSENWQNTFLDQIDLGISLHGITEIWCFDHLDCGAYRAFNSGDDSRQAHIDKLIEFKSAITNIANTGTTYRENIKVKLFLMSLDGRIEEIDKQLNYGINVDLDFAIEQNNNAWKYATFALASFLVLYYLQNKTVHF